MLMISPSKTSFWRAFFVAKLNRSCGCYTLCEADIARTCSPRYYLHPSHPRISKVARCDVDFVELLPSARS